MLTPLPVSLAKSFTRPATVFAERPLVLKKMLLSARIISAAFILRRPQVVLISLQYSMK
jgi:hypothetical protein